MDETLAELIFQWRTGSRAFVIRKLVDMQSSADAAYYAAQLAMAIMDPLDLFDALSEARAGRAPTLLATPARKLEPRKTPPARKKTPPTPEPDRPFSLSDLPAAADAGSFDVDLDTGEFD
jgi:hypothetical protein